VTAKHFREKEEAQFEAAFAAYEKP